MAFLSKVGNLLRHAVASRPISSELSSVSRPLSTPIFQARRCFSSSVSSKLFIGGLSYGTDDQSLREAFSRYGEVIEARVIMDRETGRSRGFGFVTFTSSDEASNAVQDLDGQDLHGRRVRVNFANERARPRSNFGYGAPGGYAGGYGAGQGGYGSSAGGYGNPQGGYGSNPAGYGAQQGGYGSGQAGYGARQGGYESGQGGYGSGQPGYGTGQGGYASGQAGNIGNFGSGGDVGFGQGVDANYGDGNMGGGYDTAGTKSGSFSGGSEASAADVISDAGTGSSFSTVTNEQTTEVGFDDNDQFASNVNSSKEDDIDGFDDNDVLEGDEKNDNEGEDYAKKA